MAQTERSATNKCPKCGRSFESVKELREHQATCSGAGRSSGKASERAKRDMLIEDRFEATDN